MDRCYSSPLLRPRREIGFSLVAVWLLGAGMLFNACQPSQPAPSEVPITQDHFASASRQRETCRPILIQIPDQPASVQAGSWKYRFNVLLVGCSADISSITSTQKDEIVQLASEEIRRSSLDITAQFRTPAFRSRLRDAVNRALGTEAVSDIYLNLLMAAESM
jgi:hypothetical protein